LSSTKTKALPGVVNAAGVWEADWAPLLPLLLDSRRTLEHRAAQFHETLAQTICVQAAKLRRTHGNFNVGLTGGVFQNRRLADRAATLLRELGFDVYLPLRVPCNDGGLCFGQVIEAACRNVGMPGTNTASTERGESVETT
jgi:hydrogenase maturation protein HypF